MVWYGRVEYHASFRYAFTAAMVRVFWRACLHEMEIPLAPKHCSSILLHFGHVFHVGSQLPLFFVLSLASQIHSSSPLHVCHAL